MQYFYLVCVHYDECCYPEKVFLQRIKAVKYGRKLATKLAMDGNYEVVLYRQPITETGSLKRVATLEPYKNL